MPDTSARLSLPLLQPGQAQKELFHNEALARIDLAIHAVAAGVGVNAPPASPAVGACWIVGVAPSGAWAGQARALAGWTSGGWRFVAPVAGMLVWSAGDARWVWFDGTAWVDGPLPSGGLAVGGAQVVGAQAAAIAGPSGGATVDAEARAAIGAILGALRGHGLIAS